MHFRSALAAVFLALVGVTSAQAQNYSFNCASNNSSANCSTGESQLGMSLRAVGTSVLFTFTNTGSIASSITDIYFDWTRSAYALAPGAITASSGVSFSWGASPGNLPSGGTFRADIGADSNAPTQPNGVNPGEWVAFTFANESLSNLMAGLSSRQLQVGLHVQGFRNGGSESFISHTPAIPEPGTYAMLLAGLGLVSMVARRRKA